MWPDPKNSLAVIGAAIGYSANAVSGKVGRIGLPRRANPAKPKQAADSKAPAPNPQPTARRYARGEPTLPPLPSLM